MVARIFGVLLQLDTPVKGANEWYNRNDEE